MNPHITITCPNCQKSFDVDASLEGRHGRCDSCLEKFLIQKPSPPRSHPPIQPTQVTAKSSSIAPIITAIAIMVPAGAVDWFYSDSTPDSITTEVVAEMIAAAPSIESDHQADTTNPSEETIAHALPPLGNTFAVQAGFTSVDIRQYRETYPEVGQGWMPNHVGDADEARRWGIHLGPLGVRVRSHVPQLQNRAAFAAIVPTCIRAISGELALTAAEVVSIAPRSPADGYLQPGDLIIAIEGEMLQSGNQYRPDWEFMHKDAREIQLMLGEKIDQGQGRGDVRLTVLRMPEASAQPLPVERKELWRGIGGNQSVGIQKFDLDIPGGGRWWVRGRR